MISEANIGIIVAFITAISALIVSIVTAILRKRDQTYLENLKDELDKRKEERDALRDYQYEARKRLYREFAPIMFQLNELSESAYKRITGLARTARSGHLEENKGWLSKVGYFTISTIYRLVSPLAGFKLLQRQLTLFDLKLDPSIEIQYSLAKALYFTFQHDFDLARREPALEYDPHSECSDNERKNNPAKYCLQGIFWGVVDSIAESLIVQKPKESPHILSFGEFQNTYFDSKNNRGPFQELIDLFLNFHPKTSPVLWRILISQAYIYQALMLSRRKEFSEIQSSKTIELISELDHNEFDWRQTGDDVSDEDFAKTFMAVKHYLQERLN